MATGAPGQFVSRALDANLTEVAASDAIKVDDLDNIVAHVIQAVDAGTVVAAVEHSFDGTHWSPVGATIAESDFAAAAGAVVERALEASNGMPIRTNYVRLNVTTHSSTGEYTLVVGARRISYII